MHSENHDKTYLNGSGELAVHGVVDQQIPSNSGAIQICGQTGGG